MPLNEYSRGSSAELGDVMSALDFLIDIIANLAEDRPSVR